ncbi:MAG: histidinol-phosphate aminotransferase family protein [Clostridiales bacterium]|nr:histidinol-phosphate aminotransferase family protein [Clostridiales bacterium]
MYGIRKTLLTQQRNDYSEHLSQGSFELDCSLGSNPYGAWPGLALPQELLHHMALYPHASHRLAEAICRHYEDIAALTPGQVLLTCGSIGAVLTLNRMVLVQGKCILGLAPQFSAVVDDFITYDAAYSPVFLKQEDNYAFRLDAFLEAVRLRPNAYIYLDNPNNPTGQVIPLRQVEEIVALAQALDSFVVMDEAYGDYVEPRESAVGLIEKYDNLAVVRTFSKGLGAAGIRLGYILAQPAIIGAAGKVNVPFSSNTVAEHVATSLLTSGWARQCGERIQQDKRRLIDSLTDIKVAETASCVPISMLYTASPDIDLCGVLEQAGVRAITGVGYGGIGKNAVRLNLHEDVDRLIDCMGRAEKILSSLQK